MELVRTIEQYCNAWNQTQTESCRRLLTDIWEDEGTYTDPTVHLCGLDELVAHIGRVSQRYPGSRIEITSRIDAHHDVFRFGWRKVLADGSALPESVDFGALSTRGRLQKVIGFFGALSSAS